MKVCTNEHTCLLYCTDIQDINMHVQTITQCKCLEFGELDSPMHSFTSDHCFSNLNHTFMEAAGCDQRYTLEPYIKVAEIFIVIQGVAHHKTIRDDEANICGV